MRVDVSIGECVDKLSILDIKLSKITNESKLKYIQEERRSVYELTKEYIESFPSSYWYSLLVHINTQIWDLTDRVKGMDRKADSVLYSETMYEIFEYNQQRFRLKNRFNQFFDSSLKEQKSYAESVVRLDCSGASIEDVLRRVGSIQKLALNYDKVIFLGDSQLLDRLKIVFSYIPFSFESEEAAGNVTYLNTLETDSVIGQPWAYPPLTYVSGGFLGDFIQQLSVMHSKWLRTGRKGILYITNSIQDAFRFSLEKTYDDLKVLMSMQPYIQEFKTIENVKDLQYDINLSSWRGSSLVYKSSWAGIFNDAYPGIEWGKYPWLYCPTYPQCSELVVISTSTRRSNWKFDFNTLKVEKPVFASQSQEEYDYFVTHTGCSWIPFLKIRSLEEWCSVIKSCKAFIGNLSMPLTLAHGSHTPRVILLSGWPDDKHNINMNDIWSTAFYVTP